VHTKSPATASQLSSLTEKPIVISGSGLGSLMMARMIREIYGDNRPIVFVEQASKIGGQFGSFDYGSDGLFDHGMHIYYESNVAEIDNLFSSLLPHDGWNILEGNRKDIAGLFYNGRLQLDTPYVDLRFTDSELRRRCIAELFLHIEEFVSANPISLEAKGNSAYDVTVRQFGRFIADQVFVPIFHKLYQSHPSVLDKLANHLTTINRVSLFDSKMALELMRSEVIRDRVCFPDQLRLPPIRENLQRGFYPKEFGMSRVIDRLRCVLENQNCFFLTDSRISSIKLGSESKIQSIAVESVRTDPFVLPVDHLYWTSGLPGLASLLGISLVDLPTDRNNKEIYYVNLVSPVPPKMGDLYYFYCFDAGFRTFRVTSYASYCPRAASEAGYPICVELWMPTGNSAAGHSARDTALHELSAFGVIPCDVSPSMCRVERAAGGGFPLPSLNNVRFLDVTRERIANRSLGNLDLCGVYSSPDTFFIKDVLLDANQKLARNY
jgi:protoporphyrinogen oxidase